MAASPASRPPPCCTWARAWPMAWPTCTTRGARTRPVVNVVGDHATYHLQYDAPLTSDIAGFARPVSNWICESKSARSIAADTARAVQAARCGARWRVHPDPACRHRLERGRSCGASPCPTSARHAWPPTRCRPWPGCWPKRQAQDGHPDARQGLARRRPRGCGPGAGQGRRAPAVRHLRRRTPSSAPAACRSSASPTSPNRSPPSWPASTSSSWSAPNRRCRSSPIRASRAGARPKACQFTQLAHPHEDGPQALQDLADALGAPDLASARCRCCCPSCPATRPRRRARLSVAQAMAALTPEHAIYPEEAATPGLPLLMTWPARAHTPTCRSPAARSARRCHWRWARPSLRPTAR